jgi:hypothetical protein
VNDNYDEAQNQKRVSSKRSSSVNRHPRSRSPYRLPGIELNGRIQRYQIFPFNRLTCFALSVASHRVFLRNDEPQHALLQSLIDWGESNPTIDKLALAVLATNTRAIAIYRRFEFVEEGRRIKEVKLGPGEYVDDILMYRLVGQSDA